MSEPTLNQRIRKQHRTVGAGFNNHIAILELARSFKCLRRKFPDSVTRFDAEKVNECVGVWSSSEAACALFVLSVWAGECKTFPGFDLIDAASRIDHEDRAIIADWIMFPWWP